MKISADDQSILHSIKAELLSFRRHCRPKEKIPEPLRQAILKTIDDGIKAGIVARELSLSPGQIASWRLKATTRHCMSPSAKPRILSITPEVPAGLRVSYEAGRLLLEFSF